MLNSTRRLSASCFISPFQHISSRRHKDRAAGKPAKPKYSPYTKPQKGQTKQPVSQRMPLSSYQQQALVSRQQSQWLISISLLGHSRITQQETVWYLRLCSQSFLYSIQFLFLHLTGQKKKKKKPAPWSICGQYSLAEGECRIKSCLPTIAV